jgi:hypothetical protein
MQPADVRDQVVEGSGSLFWAMELGARGLNDGADGA